MILLYARWWHWFIALAVLGACFWICSKLMPLFIGVGAVIFCLLYPNCHFG